MPNPFTIRSAKPEDAKTISELVIPLVEEFISFEYSKQGAKIMLDSMSVKQIESNIHQSFDYIVAETKSQIVAVLAIKNSNHIFHFFVNKDFHRKGLGEKLWRYWLESSNAELITVNSSKFAIDFYQVLGFKSIGDVFEKNGIICYPMIYSKK